MCLLLVPAGAAAQDFIGTLENRNAEEISGLARSLKDPNILWGHNDSGNAAVLFRVGLNGENMGAVKLTGGSLVDWEDIAAFEWRGQPALLLADTGDNLAMRDHVTLYAVSDPGRSDTATLLWRLDFRYPDGARDCEAVAVDAHRAEILLLSKRDQPPRLYRLPLPQKPPREQQTAEFLGAIRSIPKTALQPGLNGVWRQRWQDMPTAMDISADGRRVVIVTPFDAYIYWRAARQTWLDVLNKPPRRVPLPRFPQIEAGAFSADGRTLYIASEQRPMGFAAIALPP